MKKEKNLEKRKTGFSVPNDYFKTIDRKMLDGLKINKIHTGFEVPKDYFSNIDDELFSKLSENRSPIFKLRHVTILKRIIPIAIAASIALILFFNRGEGSLSFKDISSKEIEDWIADDLIELETSQIAEVFDDIILDNQDLSKKKQK